MIILELSRSISTSSLVCIELERQVKMEIWNHDDNDNPLATAVAGKSAPFFSVVMGCVEDNLTLKEVNEHIKKSLAYNDKRAIHISQIRRETDVVMNCVMYCAC